MRPCGGGRRRAPLVVAHSASDGVGAPFSPDLTVADVVPMHCVHRVEPRRAPAGRPERARAVPALGRSHQDGSERGPRRRQLAGSHRRCHRSASGEEQVCERAAVERAGLRVAWHLCCAPDRWREAHLRKRRGSRTFQAPGSTPWRFGSARHFEVSEGSQYGYSGRWFAEFVSELPSSRHVSGLVFALGSVMRPSTVLDRNRWIRRGSRRARRHDDRFNEVRALAAAERERELVRRPRDRVCRPRRGDCHHLDAPAAISQAATRLGQLDAQHQPGARRDIVVCAAEASPCPPKRQKPDAVRRRGGWTAHPDRGAALSHVDHVAFDPQRGCR